jgi:hypothetical protein
MQDLQNYNVRKNLQNAYNIRTTNKASFRITPSNGFERRGNDLSRPLTIGEAAPKGIETEIRPITTHNLTLFPGPCKRTHNVPTKPSGEGANWKITASVGAGRHLTVMLSPPRTKHLALLFLRGKVQSEILRSAPLRSE